MHIEDGLVIEHLTKNVSWLLNGHFYLTLQLRVYFELGVDQQVLHNTLGTIVGLHETRVNQVGVIRCQFSVVTVIVKSDHSLVLNRRDDGILVLYFSFETPI